METVGVAHREPLRMTRAEEKVPGGKLVRLVRETSASQVRIQLSGDFFIHPEDGVHRIEETLSKLPDTAGENSVRGAIEKTAQDCGIELIGIDAGTIARLFAECCRCGE